MFYFANYTTVCPVGLIRCLFSVFCFLLSAFCSLRFAVFIFVELLLSFMFFVGSFFLYPFLATFFLAADLA
jgi:hypothetical protein